MIQDVDLSGCQYIFDDERITGLRKVNYFYGKNGTGKSSLVSAIKQQYANQYNIKIFQGFEKLIGSNEYLNAIVLGTENLTVTEQLKTIDGQLDSLISQIDVSGLKNYNKRNLFDELQESKNNCLEKKADLDKKLSKAARELKNHHIVLTGANYNRNHLKKDLDFKHGLSNDAIKSNQKIVELKKLALEKQQLPKLPIINSLSELRDETNAIVNYVVTPGKVIAELNTSDKRKFAQLGMKIHDRKANQNCIFCGNEISDERWDTLDAYFSNKIENLKSDVKNQIDKITFLKNKLDEEIYLNRDLYHPVFEDERKKLENQINNNRKSILNYLTVLSSELTKKNDNLFLRSNELSLDIPADFDNDQRELDDLWKKNLRLNNNLKEEIEKAKSVLKLHFVSKLDSKFGFLNMINELDGIMSKKDYLQNQIKAEQEKKTKLQKEREKLIESTKSEFTAVKKINQLISSLGNDSFRLKHFKSSDGQKGLYKIIDRNGNERLLASLSTGEKNLLAFLWFLYDVNNLNKNNDKEEIIIFDDSTNGNDESSRDLIIKGIQHLLDNEKTLQFFILTHDKNSYLQLKPKSEQLMSDSISAILLIREGKTSIKKIEADIGKVNPSYNDFWAL